MFFGQHEVEQSEINSEEEIKWGIEKGKTYDWEEKGEIMNVPAPTNKKVRRI